jgi:hypothetical protein
VEQKPGRFVDDDLALSFIVLACIEQFFKRIKIALMYGYELVGAHKYCKLAEGETLVGCREVRIMNI